MVPSSRLKNLKKNHRKICKLTPHWNSLVNTSNDEWNIITWIITSVQRKKSQWLKEFDCLGQWKLTDILSKVVQFNNSRKYRISNKRAVEITKNLFESWTREFTSTRRKKNVYRFSRIPVKHKQFLSNEISLLIT